MTDFSKMTKAQLLEELAKKNAPTSQGAINFSDSENEMAKIDRMTNVANPNQIPFTESSDHVNVMLYTALNKKVGPLHPDNAKRTMIRWKRAGIQLYTSKRTPQQIEEFKKTDLYKEAHAKHVALRKFRKQQSSKGKNEKMIQDIARVTAEAVAGAK